MDVLLQIYCIGNSDIQKFIRRYSKSTKGNVQHLDIHVFLFIFYWAKIPQI